MLLITDSALDEIASGIFTHQPERGGALMGAPGRPVITEFILDSKAATTPASYQPSRNLTKAIRAAERRGLEHKGILHSHPGGLRTPSGQDLVAFADSLEINPHLSEYIVPIANHGVRATEAHHVAVNDDALTFWVAQLSRRGDVECFPRTTSILPIGALADAVAAAIEGSVVDAPLWVALDEREMIAVQIETKQGQLRLHVPDSYPISAPVLLIDSDHKVDEITVPWTLADEPIPQVVAAIDAWRARNASPATDTNAAEREPVARGAIDPTAALTERSVGLLPADLAKRSALVIGAGSVGSWLCDGLVRSGVGALTVVDHDVVEAHNLGRTCYRWDQVGRPKAAALTEHLRAINPAVELSATPKMVEPGSGRWLRQKCAEADLVIAATDDPVAQRQINLLARGADRPSLFVGIYDGASGGEIVISSPSRTACYQCATSVRHSQNAGGTAVHRPTDYGTGRLEGAVGLHADIGHVTSAALKIALSLLSVGSESSLGDFVDGAIDQDASYLVMGMEPSYWFFDEVFAQTAGQYAYQSIWMTPEPNPTCPVCGIHAGDGDDGSKALDITRPDPAVVTDAIDKSGSPT